MKNIVYTRPDGGVSVVVPSKNHVARLMRDFGISEEAAIQAIQNKDVPPDATDINLVEENEKPGRTFRNAWKVAGGAVQVDMPKARVIHMDRIREERNKELDRLDKEFNKENGRGRNAQAAAIEAQRETLRNIPATFDLSVADTPEALDALWPPEIPR